MPDLETVLQEVPPTTVKPARKKPLTLSPAPGVGVILVHVPAGDFLMGSAPSGSQANTDEYPQHTIHLDEFYIGQHEVTVAQFAAFVSVTHHRTTAEREGRSLSYTERGVWQEVQGINWQHPLGPNSSARTRASHPVNHMSWDDAMAFCRWAGEVTRLKVCLPTEAEWEKAARGTDGRTYPWGNDPPDSSRCNFSMSVRDTVSVGRCSPKGDSPYGCADMAGNVWEWTSSLYNSYPYRAQDGRENMDSRNPRVLRGGAFYIGGRSVRAANRRRANPDTRESSVGFRICLSPI